MPELTPAGRVIALLEWGDVAEADVEIERAGGWQGRLWQGTRALMEGRFFACERLAAEAARLGTEAGDPQAGLASGVLAVATLREQQRAAEAEIMLRLLLEQNPSAPAGAHALLALLVGEMGRDSQARSELARLVPRDPLTSAGRLPLLFLLAELAASIEGPHEDVELLYRRLLPHAGDFAVDEHGAAWYGSVAYVLGRLAHVRGRWEEAAVHYADALAAHRRVGAPLLLAHTQRHLSALLRVHGAESDWDRALGLLADAASIYGQLGVDGRAAETQAVLARSGYGADGPRSGAAPAAEVGAAGRPVAPSGAGDRAGRRGGARAYPETVFRRLGDGWEIGRAGQAVRLRDATGLHDIARLLAAPMRSIHVTDLLWPSAPAPEERLRPVLDDRTRQEYGNRLAELAGELVEAERAADAVGAALVRAERDAIEVVLADDSACDSTERARQAVGTRIRISLDRIERAQPPVGRHLRTSIRTGTFCSYEPDEPVTWRL